MFRYLLRSQAIRGQIPNQVIIDDLRDPSPEEIKGYINDWIDSLEDKEYIQIILPQRIEPKYLLHFVQLLVQYNINVKFIYDVGEFDFEYLYDMPKGERLEVFE